MKIGFTGTRKGMTAAQKETVAQLLEQYAHDELHHGCCEGADRECHALEHSNAPIEGHPSTIGGQEQWAMRHCTVVHPPLPPLDRNSVIVATCDMMIATPGEFKEVIR